MYDERFGLHRKPFQSVIGEHDFFESQSYREVESGILHALRSDLGVAVLTGPAGVGKSVALEQLQRLLEPKTQTFLLRGGAVQGSAELLYLLHRKLVKLQPSAEASAEIAPNRIIQRCEVVERLERCASFWGPLAILLDDAHLVTADVFSELRSLLEEGADGRRVARLLIAGPLLLEEVLAESGNSHFARKIRTHGFLEPLRSDESVRYLNQQFSNCGGVFGDAFESSAVELIVSAADGIPQCLNLLADECLMLCHESDVSTVDRPIVQEALNRLRHLPYSWNVSLVQETTQQTERTASDDETDMGESAIEIGEFPSDDSETTAYSFESESVIEIGGEGSVVEADVQRHPETIEEPMPEVQTLATVEVVSAESLVTSSSIPVDDDIEIVVGEDNTSTAPEGAVEISAEEFEGLELEEIATADDEADDALVEVEVEETDLSNEHLFATLYSADAADDREEPADEESTFDVTEESADLQAEAQDNSEVPDSAETDAEESSFPDEVLPVEDVVHDETVSEAIAEYEPWSPAGNWPAESVAISDETTSVTETAVTEEQKPDFSDEPFPADDWNELSDTAGESPQPATAEAPAEETNLEAVETLDEMATILQAEAVPVVDRFTWAELGRGEDPEAAPSFTQTSVAETLHLTEPAATPAWPPVVNGVAPASQIPVSDLDDDYAELLTDLGLLIDATSERLNGDEAVETTAAQPSFEQIQTALAEVTSETSGDPESTIEELQQLIEEEQQLDDAAETDDVIAESEPEQESESGSSATEELSSVDGWIEDAPSNDSVVTPEAAPRFFSMEAPELPPQQSEQTASEGDQPPSNLNDSFPSVSDDHDPDVVAFQQVTEQREEWQEEQQVVAEIVCDEEAEDERKIPETLRQARTSQRQRIVSIGLKQAAGAETVAAADESMVDSENQPSSPAPISLMITDPEPEADDETAKAPVGFANLFTRLRRRRGKAS